MGAVNYPVAGYKPYRRNMVENRGGIGHADDYFGVVCAVDAYFVGNYQRWHSAADKHVRRIRYHNYTGSNYAVGWLRRLSVYFDFAHGHVGGRGHDIYHVVRFR